MPDPGRVVVSYAMDGRSASGGNEPHPLTLTPGEGDGYRTLPGNAGFLLTLASPKKYNRESTAAKGHPGGSGREGPEMNDDAFADRIEEARRKIESLPEDQREPLFRLLDETRQRHHDLTSNFSRLRHLMDDWRIKMKYLTFDLEATKRELAELRRKQSNQG
jgi:hypothetical protein